MNLQFENSRRKSFVPSLIVPSDIISYWNFENNFNDSIGVNNGTSNAAVFSTTNKISGSRSVLFDYTTTPDYISVPYNNSLDFSNTPDPVTGDPRSKPFSISMWVYFTEDKSAMFICQRDGGLLGSIQLFYNSSINEFRFQVIDGEKWESTGSYTHIMARYVYTGSIVGNWINIVATFNGLQNCELFINNDNNYVSSNTNGFEKIKNYSHTLKFGVFGWDLSDTSFAYKGYIDEAYLFNKSLSESEIENIYLRGLNGLNLI